MFLLFRLGLILSWTLPDFTSNFPFINLSLLSPLVSHFSSEATHGTRSLLIYLLTIQLIIDMITHLNLYHPFSFLTLDPLFRYLHLCKIRISSQPNTPMILPLDHSPSPCIYLPLSDCNLCENKGRRLFNEKPKR